MRRAIIIVILFLLTWACAGLIKPAFSHPADVRDVVPRDVDGATYLNITVWHNVESSLHFVDIIEVTWGSNITSLTFDPKALAPGGTFTVNYNMGPMSETTTITVRARCTVTGYSGATSWTGTITEPSPTPSPSPSPTPTQTPAPTPSPTPTISPSPSLSPTKTPSPSPEPSAEPTQSPEPQQPEPFPTVPIAATSVMMAVIAIGLFVYFKKRK